MQRIGAPLVLRCFIHAHMLELEDHTQFASVQIRIIRCGFNRCAARFADGHRVVTAQHLAVHLPQIQMLLRSARNITVRSAVAGEGFLRLGNHVDDVHAETVNALIQPPAHHIVYALAHLLIVPVEVCLLFGKHVQIILAGRFVLLPCASGEDASLAVRHAALKRRTPDIEITLWIILVGSGFLEPRMLRRRVVDHQIHDDADAPRMRLTEQLVKVLHRAEFRSDGAVIADVVSAVHAGILVNGVEPDDIRAQLMDVIELFRHAAQIADTVAVGVHKALGINLINDRTLEPITHR